MLLKSLLIILSIIVLGSIQLYAQKEQDVFYLLDSTTQIVLERKKSQYELEGICTNLEQSNRARKEALRLLRDYLSAELDASRIVDAKERILCIRFTYDEKLKQSKKLLDSILTVRNLERFDFVDEYVAKRIAKIKRE